MAVPLFRYWRTGRFLAVAAVVFVLTVLHGAYVTYVLLPKIYYAYAEVRVRTLASDPSVAQEVVRLRSAEFLWPVITGLGLDRIWVKRVYRSDLDALPEDEAVFYMRRVTVMTVRPGTNMIIIRAASEVPTEAAAIANALADQFASVRGLDDDRHVLRTADPPPDQAPVIILSRAVVPRVMAFPMHGVDLLMAAIEGLLLALVVPCLVELAAWYVAPRLVATEGGKQRASVSEEY